MESAICEIRQTLRQYGGSIIGINDSVFGWDLEWLLEFSGRYRHDIHLPFYCHAEVSMCTEKYVDLLKYAGCHCLLLGLETGDSTTRRNILNKNFGNDDFLKVLHLIRSRGVKVGIYNMIGVPGSPASDDFMTYEINRRIRPENTRCQIFSFYPGSALYESKKAVDNFRVSRNLRWAGVYDSETRKNLSRLQRFQCLFSISVYLNIPAPIVKFLICLPLRPIYAIAAFFTLRMPFYYMFRRWLVSFYWVKIKDKLAGAAW